ncbi:hypothetical protein PTKIN_Ptkin18bG0037100 [Pterospermum kingtungense]
MEILESVKLCIAKAVDKATADGYNVGGGLKAIGLTNQRETTLLWGKSTGCPFYNAIVWMDARTSSVCSCYFKVGDALFGTIDTWLIWNLTGGINGGLHVSDVSNASWTMLMNLTTLDWDKTALETLGIPAEIQPKIISNSEVIGKISKGWPIPGIPIAGCLGDQHAAMVGHACRNGEAKSTYGTGAFILINTVQWLRDSLGRINSASEIESLALQVDSTGGVYFVPAFNGLFAPWWGLHWNHKVYKQGSYCSCGA